jgi:hypothetical protein
MIFLLVALWPMLLLAFVLLAERFEAGRERVASVDSASS